MYAKDFKPVEMMIVAASREISNGQTLMTGTQWPIVIALLAKKTHAPDIVIAFEGGIIYDTIPTRVPFFTAEPCLMANPLLCGDTLDTLGMILHAGRTDLAFLSGANVDRYGNVNTTCLGDYPKPKFRFAGSGGACDFGCLASRLIVVLEHDKKRFPEKVDYITTPGKIGADGARERAGLNPGTGIWAVYTTLGRFKFDKDSGEMYLDGYYPGVSVQKIKENISWDLKVSDKVEEIEPPTEEYLRILREEIDPFEMYIENARANRECFKTPFGKEV